MDNDKIMEEYDNYLRIINCYIDELKSRGIGVAYYEDEITTINISSKRNLKVYKLECLYLKLCEYYLFNLKNCLDNNVEVVDNVKNINNNLRRNKDKSIDKLSLLERKLKVRIISLILAVSTTVSLGSVLSFKIGKEKVYSTKTTSY